MMISGRLAAAAGRCLLASQRAPQCQALRCLGGGADRSEPKSSPWVKVLERPGDGAGNRSESAPVVNEGQRPLSPDAEDDLTEKHPDSVPQARTDPSVLAANEANPLVDSIRHMAGKLNEAVGGSFDFPKTGGATIRAMASEIGDSIGEATGLKPEKALGNDTPLAGDQAQEADSQAVDDAAAGARAAYQRAKDAVSGGGTNSSGRSR